MKVVPNTQKNFKRVSANVNYEMMNDGFTVSWSTKFDWDSSEKAYFAWTFPYSFEETLAKSQQMQDKYGTDGKKNKTIYFKRELLSYSYERRPMELLTFSSKEGLTAEREPLIEGLFPEGGQRPYKFKDKKTIFLSSRVHPGETPA